LDQLKLLQATDLSNANQALGNTLDYLNAYRLQANSPASGLPYETIGSGRFPTGSEQCIIMWFTDGGIFSTYDKNMFSVTQKVVNCFFFFTFSRTAYFSVLSKMRLVVLKKLCL
jgi:hypothetical protein